MPEETGTFIRYVPKNFGREALLTIGQANAIIEEYGDLKLSLRQLYYQFVTRKHFANTGRNYDRLKDVISDARLAGLVSWTAIEDRGRYLEGLATKRSPRAAVQAARDDYLRDLWEDQLIRPEVWVEKQALAGVVGAICNELRVDFFATKGYNSQSEQWAAGQRMAGYVRAGQRPVVIHLGDHDPSGIDMTRDNAERLSMFAGVPIAVQRIALNMDQVEHFRLPPDPAKLSDSRAAGYIRTFGTTSSWELDAIDPAMIQKLIKEAVDACRDGVAWDVLLKKEAEDMDELDAVLEDM